MQHGAADIAHLVECLLSIYIYETLGLNISTSHQA